MNTENNVEVFENYKTILTDVHYMCYRATYYTEIFQKHYSGDVNKMKMLETKLKHLLERIEQKCGSFLKKMEELECPKKAVQTEDEKIEEKNIDKSELETAKDEDQRSMKKADDFDTMESLIESEKVNSIIEHFDQIEENKKHNGSETTSRELKRKNEVDINDCCAVLLKKDRFDNNCEENGSLKGEYEKTSVSSSKINYDNEEGIIDATKNKDCISVTQVKNKEELADCVKRSLNSESSHHKTERKNKPKSQRNENYGENGQSEKNSTLEESDGKFEKERQNERRKNLHLNAQNDCEEESNFEEKSFEKRSVESDDGKSDQTSLEKKKRKGRKNIKEVLTFEKLSESTKKAVEEENQRAARIEKKHTLQSFESEDDSLILDECKKTGIRIEVNKNLCKRMYEHQKKGVLFMWQACYESIERLNSAGSGCILAHCMGLGKTFQVVTLLHTLFAHDITNTKHVLVICPATTIPDWNREIRDGLEIASKDIDVILEYIGGTDSPATKCSKIRRWRDSSGILLMGYEAFTKLIFGDKFSQVIDEDVKRALLNPGPDLVICDEGHLLKNGKSKRTLAVSKIRTLRRIVMTGTPMQNNLVEYYYMVNFVKPNLLGTFKEYSNRFISPISNGQFNDSTEKDITIMKMRSHVLSESLKNVIQRFEVSELNKYLKPIRNFTVNIQLSQIQANLYEQFIEKAKQKYSENYMRMGKTVDLFTDVNVAKAICSHPYQLIIGSERKKKDNSDPSAFDCWSEIYQKRELEVLECGHKMQLALAIIEEAEKRGDKVLLFSSSLIELECVEYFLQKVGTSNCRSWTPRRDYLKMDGSISVREREQMFAAFNDPLKRSLRVFLISFKVGGIGLTLTAANRVIILGSNFNPVYDTQSIYRCYRFSQTKSVFVYRLISMGTMEEKIYRRCVSKLAIASRVVDTRQIDRHFRSSEIAQLYEHDINLVQPKPKLKIPDDDLLATLFLNFDFLFQYIDHEGLLENRPQEELNDEDKEKAWEEFRKDCEIQNMVKSYPAQPRLTSRLFVSNRENVQLPDLLTSDDRLFTSSPLKKDNPVTVSLSQFHQLGRSVNLKMRKTFGKSDIAVIKPQMIVQNKLEKINSIKQANSNVFVDEQKTDNAISASDELDQINEVFDNIPIMNGGRGKLENVVENENQPWRFTDYAKSLPTTSQKNENSIELLEMRSTTSSKDLSGQKEGEMNNFTTINQSDHNYIKLPRNQSATFSLFE